MIAGWNPGYWFLCAESIRKRLADLGDSPHYGSPENFRKSFYSKRKILMNLREMYMKFTRDPVEHAAVLFMNIWGDSPWLASQIDRNLTFGGLKTRIKEFVALFKNHRFRNEVMNAKNWNSFPATASSANRVSLCLKLNSGFEPREGDDLPPLPEIPNLAKWIEAKKLVFAKPEHPKTRKARKLAEMTIEGSRTNARFGEEEELVGKKRKRKELQKSDSDLADIPRESPDG